MTLQLGAAATVLEAFACAADEALSALYEAEHRAHGVDLRTGVIVDVIEGKGGQIGSVCLAEIYGGGMMTPTCYLGPSRNCPDPREVGASD